MYKLNQNREQYAEDICNELEQRVNSALKKQCVTVEDGKLPTTNAGVVPFINVSK